LTLHRQYASLPTIVATYSECLKRGLNLSNSNYHFCEYHKNILDEDFFATTNISMKICICINENKLPKDTIIFPETKALSISYCGSYDKIFYAYEQLKKYIIDNNYQPIGFPQEVYLEGNFNNESNKNIVLIIIPIK